MAHTLEAIIPTAVLPNMTYAANEQSLRAYVKQCIKQYFEQLGDTEPANLYKMVLEEVEIPLLKAVMGYTNGNQCKAAKILAISRGTLRKKLKMYNIS